MKTIALLSILLSTQAFAGNDFRCINPKEPNRSYLLKEISPYDTHELIIRENGKIISKDTLEFSDLQGVFLFESKRVNITIEDLEEVSYQYTVKDSSGRFVKKYATLTCKEV